MTQYGYATVRSSVGHVPFPLGFEGRFFGSIDSDGDFRFVDPEGSGFIAFKEEGEFTNFVPVDVPEDPSPEFDLPKEGSTIRIFKNGRAYPEPTVPTSLCVTQVVRRTASRVYDVPGGLVLVHTGKLKGGFDDIEILQQPGFTWWYLFEPKDI